MKLRIRKGKVSDIPQLIKLYSKVEEIADFDGQKHDRNYFLTFTKSRKMVMLVAEGEGKICGGLNAEFLDFAGYTFLTNVVVAKECRGKGISSRLIKTIERAAKKRGNKAVLLLVYDWNKKMRKVIEHYGYKSGGKTVVYTKKI